MSSLKFYVNYRSQPCRALLILFRFSDIKYEEIIVDAFQDTRQEWFIKLNPMRRIPVLVDGDFVLTESVAVAKYILNTHEVAAHWYPPDVRQRARVDEYLLWHHCQGGLRLTAVAYFIDSTLVPMKTGKPVPEEKMKQNIKMLERSLNQMETYFLPRGPYITGSYEITVADLFAVCELTQIIPMNYDVTRERPLLKAWLERVKTRLAPHFEDVHKTIFGTSFSRI